jgi:hypothetical protein
MVYLPTLTGILRVTGGECAALQYYKSIDITTTKTASHTPTLLQENFPTVIC